MIQNFAVGLRFFLVTWLVTWLVSPLPIAQAAQTRINFDDAADGISIGTYYRGVTFTNPLSGGVYARKGTGHVSSPADAAPSPPNVVSVIPPDGNPLGTYSFFDATYGAVDAHFAKPMRSISIDVRPVGAFNNTANPTRRPYLQAFDAAGNYLGQTEYYKGPLPTNSFYALGQVETLTIVVPAGNIGFARFSSQPPGTNQPVPPPTYGLFDNLKFDDGYYDIALTIVGNGTVLANPPGPYYHGSSPVLTASPAAGWTFKDWTGSFSLTQNPILPIMDGNKSLTATFVVTLQPGPNYIVTTTDDHDDGSPDVVDCTLREAINAANANSDYSIITFAPNVTGVITLQLGQLTINPNLTLTGPGAKVLAVSGNHGSRVFNIVYRPPSASVLISDLTITNGRVTGLSGIPGQIGGGTGGLGGDASGGGIYNGATLTLSNCWVVGNTAQGGMGGVGGADDATHPGGTGGNGGGGFGGGIYDSGGLTVVNCTVSGNSAVGGTGGTGFDAFDNFYLTGGTGGLGGLGLGGGVYDRIVINMVNCTLSGNSARGGTGGRGGNGFPDDPGGSGGRGQLGRGGGLFSESLFPFFMANCSLSFNSSSGGAGGPGGTGRPGTSPAGLPGTAEGGGLYREYGFHTSTIKNSLIAGNSSLAAPDCVVSCISSYNLIGVDNGFQGFNGLGDQTGTISTPLLPLLGPLQFNGGPVPTMRLLPGSPAIDKGKSALPTDARGRFRLFDFPELANASGGNGSDIGAFEVHPAELNIARSGSNFVLSWSTDEVGFALQSTAELASPTIWAIVPGRPTIVGSQFTVTINNPPRRQFYRLNEVEIAIIPGLFNTGVGTDGTPLASGTVDPHWQLIQSADATLPGPNAIVVNDTGFPIPPWLANGPASKWLAPRASQATGNQPGNYKYRISFNLTGLEPSTATINGHWTSDNSGPQVLLNGVPTGLVSDGNFTALGNEFTINTGFIAGVNTLDFVVNNGGTGINPTGVRVELSGTANFQR